MAAEHQIDNNEQLILSFFNQYLFQQAKNNIEHLDYTYCDFGIFEFWFAPEYEEDVLKSLQENF